MLDVRGETFASIQHSTTNIRLTRRGAGVVELAALEMLCTGNRTVGSNPTLSATQLRNAECGLRIEERLKHSSFVFINPQSAIRNPKSERLLKVAVLCAALTLIFAASSQAQKRRAERAQVCGEPSMNCAKANEFQPHDLQFRLPRRAVIYESEP